MAGTKITAETANATVRDANWRGLPPRHFESARVLPQIGLGAAFGLIGARVFIAALLLFAIGIACGLFAEDRLLWVLDTVPRAGTPLFLHARLRSSAEPAAAAIFGTMLGLTIKLTDPSLHEPAFTWTQVLIAFWIVAAVSLPLRAFWRGWFPIFGRILGSWLLAIGLLYGGASLVRKRDQSPPAVAMPGPSAPVPDSERMIPGLPGPG